MRRKTFNEYDLNLNVCTSECGGVVALPDAGKLIFSTWLKSSSVSCSWNPGWFRPTEHRIPSIIPAVNVYSSCTPSITFPLKFLLNCRPTLVFRNCLTMLNFFSALRFSF